MKAPISTALSMAAILATGGAALAVNATVMNPQAATSPSSSDAPSGPNPSLGANEFQIPGVGLVTLMTIGDKLVLESVAVNDGFTYVISESSPGHFDIRFESADRVVTFTARLADGQIITSATSMNSPAPAPAPAAPAPASAPTPASGDGTAPGSGVSDDDGYDDDYEYEFEDDDHDEGHDDDHDDD